MCSLVSLVAFPSVHDEKEFLQPAGGVKLRRRFASSGDILACLSTPKVQTIRSRSKAASHGTNSICNCASGFGSHVFLMLNRHLAAMRIPELFQRLGVTQKVEIVTQRHPALLSARWAASASKARA